MSKHHVVALSAIRHAVAYQNALKNTQDRLLEKVTAVNDESQLHTVVQRISNNLAQDKAEAAEFDSFIKERPDVHFGMTYNKMPLILDGASEFINSEDHRAVYEMLTGRLPVEYDNTIDKITNIGVGEFYGSSKSTYLNYVLMSAYMAHYEDYGNVRVFENLSHDWLTKSPIVHGYKMSDGFAADYQVSNLQNRFVDNGVYYTIHSGYSFANSMLNQGDLYANGKAFYPMSSPQLVSYVIGDPNVFNTADLLNIYRTHWNEKYGDNLYCNLAMNEHGYNMHKYEVVDDISQVRIGDIFALRNYNDNNPKDTTLGFGGHASIVIDVQQDGSVTTIEANRDMPNIEGIGLRSNINVVSTDAQQVFFLRLKDDQIKHVPYYDQLCDIEYSGLSDLQQVYDWFNTVD